MQSDAISWVEQVLGRSLVCCEAVSGGKNNRAWYVQTNQGKYFVKQYFNDNDDRFLRETQFLSLLCEHSVTAVPRILESDADKMIAVYSWIDGALDFNLDKERVSEAANFIRQINSPDVVADAGHLVNARGALRNLEAFLDDIRIRISAFDDFQIESEVDKDFVDVMRKQIKPLAAQLEEQYLRHSCLKNPFRLCLSPSDFGFHNALLGQSLSFVDFEYAGWDSAEKLITDFFAQPRYAIPAGWMEPFVI